jgi:antimicrobial peptide system SdpB family protein
MITKIGRMAAVYCEQVNPHGNVYGLARSLVAVSTLATLLFNDTSVLFRPAAGIPDVPIIIGFGKFSIFALLAPKLDAARWISIAILLVVVTGWRPRLTGLLHWWITFSVQASSITIDGGDQIASILLLLLIPVTLTDSRQWHWTAPASLQPGKVSQYAASLVAISSLLMVRIQVAAIYFHSSVAKMGVAEWADGTALYYWFRHPTFGVPPWLRSWVDPLLLNGVTVALLTWGAVAFELLLFMALIMPKRFWQPLLIAGIAFHFLIALFHGLMSFSLIMSAALILYLRPHQRPFALEKLRARVGELTSAGQMLLKWLPPRPPLTQ